MDVPVLARLKNRITNNRFPTTIALMLSNITVRCSVLIEIKRMSVFVLAKQGDIVSHLYYKKSLGQDSKH